MTRPLRRIDPRPLYAQVRDALRERIRSGAWRPGAALPNEFEIAGELGVSQGTARKALDALAAERLIERHQGRGSFVVEMTPQSMLFRFFNIHDTDGSQVLPDSRRARIEEAAAGTRERARLGLAPGARVIRIRRIRTRGPGGTPFIVETIALPAALFPGLARRRDIPNTLYDLFQKDYGITVAGADERLTTAGASAREARALAIAVGTPLLRIDRLTHAIGDRPIEWRLSAVHLGAAHYLARLR